MKKVYKLGNDRPLACPERGLAVRKDFIMTLDIPNYYNSEDRRLYDELVNESFKRELTKAEKMFVNCMYHQEEYDAGLDGDR